jgi:hypothetical protein
MNEILTTFLAGILAGVVMTCILFTGAFVRALRGWERADNRIEDLEAQLQELQSPLEFTDERSES